MYYYARTTSQTAPNASDVTSTTMPSIDATNKYLWQKEVITYTNGSTQTSVILLAVYGNTGATGPKGDTGAAGKGIKSTAITYQAWSNGSSTPTGTWSSSPPATSASKPYLWTRVIITYTDNSTSTSYSVGSTPEGIVVGGKNLIVNSSRYRENSPFTNTTAEKDGIKFLPIDVYMPCAPGETYTFQCKTDGKWGPHDTGGTGGGKTHIYIYLQTANEVGTGGYTRSQHLYSDSYNGKTGRGVWTYTIPTDKEYVRSINSLIKKL